MITSTIHWLNAAVGGALVGYLFSTLLQRSKAARDELHVACGELCAAAAAAGDIGSEYWLKVPGAADVPELEIRIKGLQRRLGGYGALVRRRLHSDGADAVDRELARMFDALSGGDFGSPDRRPSPMRAVAAQERAADVILAVRTGFLEKMDGQEVLKRQLKAIHRFNLQLAA